MKHWKEYLAWFIPTFIFGCACYAAHSYYDFKTYLGVSYKGTDVVDGIVEATTDFAYYLFASDVDPQPDETSNGNDLDMFNTVTHNAGSGTIIESSSWSEVLTEEQF